LSKYGKAAALAPQLGLYFSPLAVLFGFAENSLYALDKEMRKPSKRF
jgi:hypothetical protein